jgi:hypothetical protein
MKRSLIVLVVFPSILLSLMVGCGLREKISEEDEIIATIDGSSVTLSEYRSAFEKLKSQLPNGDSLDPEGIMTLKMNMLNRIRG